MTVPSFQGRLTMYFGSAPLIMHIQSYTLLVIILSFGSTSQNLSPISIIVITCIILIPILNIIIIIINNRINSKRHGIILKNKISPQNINNEVKNEQVEMIQSGGMGR